MVCMSDWTFPLIFVFHVLATQITDKLNISEKVKIGGGKTGVNMCGWTCIPVAFAFYVSTNWMSNNSETKAIFISIARTREHKKHSHHHHHQQKQQQQTFSMAHAHYVVVETYFFSCSSVSLFFKKELLCLHKPLHQDSMLLCTTILYFCLCSQ